MVPNPPAAAAASETRNRSKVEYDLSASKGRTSKQSRSSSDLCCRGGGYPFYTNTEVVAMKSGCFYQPIAGAPPSSPAAHPLFAAERWRRRAWRPAAQPGAAPGAAALRAPRRRLPRCPPGRRPAPRSSAGPPAHGPHPRSRHREFTARASRLQAQMSGVEKEQDCDCGKLCGNVKEIV